MRLKAWTILVLYITFLNIVSVKAGAMHFNRGRGYDPFISATPDGLLLDNTTDTLMRDYVSFPNPVSEFELDFRARNLHGKPGKKYEYTNSEGKNIKIPDTEWGFFLTSTLDTLTFSLKREGKFLHDNRVSGLTITIQSLKCGLNITRTFETNLNPHDGDNLFSLSYDGNELMLKAGNRGLTEILEFNYTADVTGLGFFAGWGAKLLVSDIEIRWKDPYTSEPFWLEKFLSFADYPEDSLEGYWVMFDRELEEALIKTGGNYRLGCIREGENYLLLYLEGAAVNKNEWTPGEIKAILRQSPFEGIFEVEWVDAMKESIGNGIKAQRGEGNTLLIQFPYQYSKIRLRKVPTKSL